MHGVPRAAPARLCSERVLSIVDYFAIREMRSVYSVIASIWRESRHALICMRLHGKFTKTIILFSFFFDIRHT